jgi:hypothetical protein
VTKCFSEPFLRRFFSSPIHWSKFDERWCESNLTLPRSSWLSTDDLNAQDPGFCRHFHQFLKMKASLFVVHLQSTLFLLKMP